jgi:hypothetical protein
MTVAENLSFLLVRKIGKSEREENARFGHGSEIPQDGVRRTVRSTAARCRVRCVWNPNPVLMDELLGAFRQQLQATLEAKYHPAANFGITTVYAPQNRSVDNVGPR